MLNGVRSTNFILDPPKQQSHKLLCNQFYMFTFWIVGGWFVVHRWCRIIIERSKWWCLNECLEKLRYYEKFGLLLKRLVYVAHWNVHWVHQVKAFTLLLAEFLFGPQTSPLDSWKIFGPVRTRPEKHLVGAKSAYEMWSFWPTNWWVVMGPVAS